MSNKIITKLIILLFFNLVFIINVFAQEIKLVKRVATESEFKKIKNYVGTYEEGKNYNKIINGHGTGLIPPTEDQWKQMQNQPIIIEKIELAAGVTKAPESCDNSATPWFPPIGNQGPQGSCVSWAYGYYTKTFQEAREHNWDLSGCAWEGGSYGHPTPAYQDKIFSPAFIYNQSNYGQDIGSNTGTNNGVLVRFGCCTWDKMPYNPNDYLTFPNESAWRQAPWYRSDPSSTAGEYEVESDEDIETLKQLLNDGNLALIHVNATFFYSQLSSEDMWTLDNYNAPQGQDNHENTIVGYDDNFGPYTESGNPNTYGAFKVANSWGVGGWEHIPDGFYYISYECMKQRIRFMSYYTNYENYIPRMIAVFKINHNFRGENNFKFGIGDPNSPYYYKFNCFAAGNYPFPDNPIVLDITEFIPYITASTNQFYLGDLDDGPTPGTIESFSFEKYDDYASGIPTDVFTSTETPISTQSIPQYKFVYVNIYAASNVNVLYPNGGENLKVDNNINIKWTSKLIDSVKIELTTDNGTTWTSITSSTPAAEGIFSWAVPNNISGQCKIKISDAENSSLSDVSDDLFSIRSYGAINEIEPNDTLQQAMQVYYGDTVNASINPPGDVDYYKIDGNAGDTLMIYSSNRNSSGLTANLSLSPPGWSHYAISNQNFAGSDYQRRIVYVLQSTGIYYIRLAYWNSPAEAQKSAVSEQQQKLSQPAKTNTSLATSDDQGDYMITFNYFKKGPPILAYAYGYTWGEGLWDQYWAGFRGMFYPNGSNTNIKIDYGLTTSYGNSVVENNLNNLNESNFLLRIPEFQTSSQYHYRVTLQNESGSVVSGDYTFSTDDFAIGLGISDACGSVDFGYFYFGTALDATDGYDQSHDILAGPLTKGFGGRFKYNSVDYLNDFRPTNKNGTEIWNFIYHSAYPGESCGIIYVYWNQTELPLTGSFTLVDSATGGNLVKINMRTSFQYIDSLSLGSLQIIYKTEIIPSAFIVNNTKDAGQGSLRQAIEDTNNNPGLDTILFNIPDTDSSFNHDKGFWTIELKTPFPAITDSVLIDGYSQKNFIGNDTNPFGPEIFINGIDAGQYSNGLVINSSGVHISGLTVGNFNSTGILINKVSNSGIYGCFIGVTPTGDSPAPNGYGIEVDSCSSIEIIPADSVRNIISGNTNVGILIQDSSSNVAITDNIIGLDRTMSYGIGNGNYKGIETEYGCSNINISNNWIDKNKYGIFILGSNNIDMHNNLIGTVIKGEQTLNLGNDLTGIYLCEKAHDNLILDNNIRFNKVGVYVTDTNTVRNKISHNSITDNVTSGIILDKGGDNSILPPVIKSANYASVTGISLQNSTVEVYTDSSYQGARFLGETKTDSLGNFQFAVADSVQMLKNITTIVIDNSGNTSEFSQPLIITGVNKELNKIPKEFKLSQNYPNPFNPTTNFEFAIAKDGLVTLKVYNILGEEVTTIVNKELPAGNYKYKWNASNLASGVYFYRLKAGNFVDTKKLILMK